MRLISKLFLISITVIIVISYALVTISAGVVKNDNEDIFVIVGISDRSQSAYRVNNTKVLLSQNNSVLDSLNKLKEIKAIQEYEYQNDKLIKLVISSSKVIQANEENVFSCKINGEYISDEYESKKLQNGDIVEWIYGQVTDTETESTSISSSSSDKSEITANAKASDIWNDDLSKSLSQACEWLLVNDEPTNNYFLTLGSAGKTASVKSVNQALKKISSDKDYDTPLDLEKSILTATFCGFDARKIGSIDLVKMLLEYDNIYEYGLNATAYALIALDSNKYTVESSENNSRNHLLESLLAMQNADGSFNDSVIDKQEYISQTAIALTALSNYSTNNEAVKESIKNAFNYIKSKRNVNGYFIENSKPINSITLSKLIIAFSSNCIAPNDKNYVFNWRSLDKQLLSYTNKDGGFGINDNKVSDPAATEYAVLALASIRTMSNPYVLSKNIVPQSYIVDEQKDFSNIIKDKKFIYVLCISSALILILAVSATVYLKKHKKSSKT